MIVFVDLLYTEDDSSRVLALSSAGIEAAANNYQWGVINGFQKAIEQKVKIINSIPMGSFPKYCRILFEKEKVIENEKYSIHNIGFLNLPYIKQKGREKGLVSAVSKIKKELPDEKICLVIYSLYEPYLKALSKLKELYGETIQSVLIVTDLPGKLGLQTGKIIKRMIKNSIGQRALDACKNVDAFVVLTEQMKEPIGIGERPHIVIEGVYDDNSAIKERNNYDNKASIILYTGRLEVSLGICTLLDAFELLHENVELWLAGVGGAIDIINKRCERNSKIKYLGYMSKEDIQRIQQAADILVNPRSSDDEYTKYSFPSKTMEYLVTGVPVVMNKLPGLSEDYFKHCFFPASNSAEDLAKTISEVLSLDEDIKKEHGECARRFIIEHKSSLAQGKRVYEFLKSEVGVL